MTQRALDGQTDENTRRRGRGRGKPFPVMKFSDVLKLSEAISEHGVDGRIRRITLFDRLGRSPESGRSRQLVVDSGKYGLTSGGMSAEHLTITETGAAIVRPYQSSQDILARKFDCAIGKFEVFRQIYDKLIGQRVPGEDVLTDLFHQTSVQPADCSAAAEVFVANLRDLGLVRQISGADRVISIEQLLEELPASTPENALEPPGREHPKEVAGRLDGNGRKVPTTSRPSLHVDIQVHIDPTSSAEQIDQIFASMAKHLYGNES